MDEYLWLPKAIVRFDDLDLDLDPGKCINIPPPSLFSLFLSLYHYSLSGYL